MTRSIGKTPLRWLIAGWVDRLLWILTGAALAKALWDPVHGNWGRFRPDLAVALSLFVLSFALWWYLAGRHWQA